MTAGETQSGLITTADYSKPARGKSRPPAGLPVGFQSSCGRGASGRRRFVMRDARLQERRAPLLLCQNRRGEGSSTLSLSRRGDNGERGEKTAALIARNKVSLITTQRGLENTDNVGKSRCFVAHRCVDKERLGLIRCLLLNKLTPTPINHSGFVQEVVFSSTGGFDHCWRMTGKYDKGEKKRKRGWRRKGGGWMA